MASGGIAGQLHLNRPGYQQGNEVVPPELRALKREDKNLFKKIMSYDKDVMPEEYQVPGSWIWFYIKTCRKYSFT